MVLDYSGRRPVAKNRPRKQPVGIFAVILISAISMSFALGVLTGWFVFRPARKDAQNQVQLAGAKGVPETSPPQVQYPNPEAGAPKGVDPPLTFYETLPKGGKAVIGSGLNPAKKDDPRYPKPAPPPQPVAHDAAKPAAPAKTEERKERVQAPTEQAKTAQHGDPATTSKQPGAAGKFCVQIASVQGRKEAEALKAQLTEKGFPAYIVESNIKDRGTWFRVRVGKHLSQQSAVGLAAKVGKGSIVIPE